MLSRRRFMNDRIASENGDNLVLQNVKGSKMNALTVYGHSTQDATPSPENPVPIVSAGDEGEINVSVSDGGTQSQTLTLSTPGGLPGIPVDSGGNYTDESGQQWVCDEVDLARGKCMHRVGIIDSYMDELIDDPYISTTGQLSNGAMVYYILATPTETDLTAEEIAAYQALHTYTPNTTVSNDTGAWVKVGYREWRQ